MDKIALCLISFCSLVTVISFTGEINSHAASPNSDNDSIKPIEKKWFDFDLDVFDSDNLGEIQPKVALNLGPIDWETGEKETRYGSYYYLGGIKGDISYTFDENASLKPSVASGYAGIFWNISKVIKKERNPNDTSIPVPPADQLITESSFTYNYGAMGLQLFVEAETDEKIDNNLFVGGVNFVYTPKTTFSGGWRPPAITLSFGYAKPDEAAAREKLGLDSSLFPRFRTEVLWNWNFGEAFFSSHSIARNFEFRLDYRYVQQFDQEAAWENLDNDQYDMTDCALLYNFPFSEGQKLGIRNIYIGYSTGRMLDYVEDDDRIYVGIAFTSLR